MKRPAACMFFLIILLCALTNGAGANVVRLQSWQYANTRFSNEVRYLSGVRAQEGGLTADFYLIDTLGFNGCYFEMIRGDNPACHASISGIVLEQGWTATVDAEDTDHCSLTIGTGSETRVYRFRFIPYMGEGEWMMESYSLTGDGYSFVARVAGLWRMEITQVQNGVTEEDKVAYYFPNDGYNLVLEDLPRTLAQARELERQYPVAAIAPQDIRDRVNLREGPSTDHPRAGSLYSGVMVRILEDARGEWLYVNPLAGATQHAYVHRSLLAFGEDIWQVPDACEVLFLSSGGGTTPASFYPYKSDPAGYFQSDSLVRIAGYYNDSWAILDRLGGALYVETKYLHKP